MFRNISVMTAFVTSASDPLPITNFASNVNYYSLATLDTSRVNKHENSMTTG